MAAPDILQGHLPLYDKLKTLHDELADIEHSAKNNESHFFSLIRTLEQLLITQQEKEQGSEPLHQFFAQTLSQISQVVACWIADIDNYELNTSFRKHYGDSLLVYVYGKVKAGKSSLGNFIAYGQEKASPEWREQLKSQGHEPTFFVAEKGESSVEDTTHRNGFYVDSAEATSCIQGFTLPGLTWIDSPGIHSVTPENQALAQKYVDSADLIIYPMNSAQPGRRTDMQEIRELVRRRKRLLLLITRCDEQEADEDEEGNIVTSYQMKSARNRHLQSDYVSKEFSSLCDELGVKEIDFEVLTLSVRFSASAGNHPEAFLESGAQEFIAKLLKTVDSEGVTLKKNVPHKALQAFYRQLLAGQEESTSINTLLTPLNQLAERIVTLQARLEKRCEELKTKLANDIAIQIVGFVEEYARHQQSAKLEKAIAVAVRIQLETQLPPVINEVTETLSIDINQMTGTLNLKNHIRLEPVYQKIEIDTSGRNAAIGGSLGAALFGGAAFMLTGGLGGSIGGVAGQTIGSYIGKKIKTTRQTEVEVGDNRLALAERLTTLATETVDTTITRSASDVNRVLLEPMKETINELLMQVETIRCWAAEYAQKEL